MQFMIRGRQEGKTTEICRWAGAEPGRAIVVPFQRDVELISDNYKLRGILCGANRTDFGSANVAMARSKLYTPRDLQERRAHGRTAFAIDDLDRVLREVLHIAGSPLEIVSSTGEPV